MAYFRPLNSPESNLYTVRIITDVLSTSNFSSQALKFNAYLSPQKNVLPKNLSITYDTTNLYFTVDYTNAGYVLAPSIEITLINNVTSGTIVTYTTNIKSISSTACIFFVLNSSSSAIIPSTADMSKIQLSLTITGQINKGPIFAVSNRGLTFVSKDDGNTTTDQIYTMTNVGIGTTNPQYSLINYGTQGYNSNVFVVNETNVNTLQAALVAQLESKSYILLDIRAAPVSSVVLAPSSGSITYDNKFVAIYVMRYTSSTPLTISIANMETSLGTNASLSQVGKYIKLIGINAADQQSSKIWFLAESN